MRRSPVRGVVGSQYAILCGMLLLVPEVSSALLQITSHVQQRLWGALPTFADCLRPYFGEEALTAAPRELVEIVRAQRLSDFSLSPGMVFDEQILQRVTEGAWPSQLRRHSSHLFLLKGEPLPERCEARERRESVVYAHCG